MPGKMCPLITVVQNNPISCRHDCAWYVVLPPTSEFEGAREGCALNMLAREVTEVLPKLLDTYHQTIPARA
jgi:hypothetical protein